MRSADDTTPAYNPACPTYHVHRIYLGKDGRCYFGVYRRMKERKALLILLHAIDTKWFHRGSTPPKEILEAVEKVWKILLPNNRGEDLTNEIEN